MTTPAVAAARFCMAAAVGTGLGLFYGFLRPLRRKSNWFTDLIFVIATFFGWLYVGFGICRGDLRMAYFAGMALGGFGWEMTVGKLLRPVFFGFWQGIRKILAVIAFPMKKIFEISRKIAKKVFAKCRKWVTMEKKKFSTYRLRESCGIDSKTIRRLKANENIETKTLDKICSALHCRIEDIAEFVEE